MRFTSSLITALVAGASAVAAALPTCSPPDTAGIMLPKKNATLTREKPFQFYFCSRTYFRASTKSIDVVLSQNSTLSAGVLVKANLVTTVASESTYYYNLTIPQYYGPLGKAYIGVFERIDGYYSPAYAVETKLVFVK